jgi:hypothetical protein
VRFCAFFVYLPVAISVRCFSYVILFWDNDLYAKNDMTETLLRID